MEDALWAQLQNNSLEEHDDKDRIEIETDEEDEEDEKDDEETWQDQDMDSQFSRPHDSLEGPQTGPKGVKADHDYYEQKKREYKSNARADYNARMLAKAPTTTTYQQDQLQERLDEELVLQHENALIEADELRFIREKRLRELQNPVPRHEKTFGRVETIDADDYADVIDDEHDNTPVIIHLFDESIDACIQLDKTLRELASQYVFAKFLRVSANDLDFDLVGSPAILGYKAGNLVANLVRFVDFAGSRMDTYSVEETLLNKHALSENEKAIKEDTL